MPDLATNPAAVALAIDGASMNSDNNAVFEAFSWHDCHIWDIELRAGDFDTGDWCSDLVLDIGYIAE